ncbi:predicted protein [Naegleria gruberi]|uniref:Predicted protein n=1 Tax=Naegleria gruberi TaxID=5762 RepID=D2VDI8_NAEGR|nr:uncharacterized protein NAEGRDRAFT_66858 [Naegleria gruberi]EFC45149.1 predicted protein [Naegleria gruberi]|eukprot:XP_002677893.1 predicted protein [Naegleria gruberi strain NEG-M]
MIKVSRVSFLGEGLEYRIYEYQNVRIYNEDDADENSLVVLTFIEIGELNGYFYMFSESEGSGRNLEQVHRLKIIEENNASSIQVERIYKSFETSYVRILSPLLADRERNCFYWFGGYRIRKSTSLKDCIKFNVETCEFEFLTNFQMGFVLHSQSSLFWKNRYVIVFGGWITSCFTTANIYAFDVENRNWYSIYCIDDTDEEVIPKILPRYNSGMVLVSNRWASKFNATIPSNDDMDTLFIYGGHIDYMDITRDTHEVLLFHLDESLFQLGEVITETHIPFSLTNYCKDYWEKKLSETEFNLFKDNFKILPTTNVSTIYNFKCHTGKERLYILNGYDKTSISKLDLCDMRSLFNSNLLKFSHYWDVQFSFL